MYDFSTNNKRFIKAYKNLERHGYHSPSVILNLYHPTLKGVSPYSERLSKATEATVLRECDHNPWYVLREIIRNRVGASKRFVDITNAEIVALLNFLEGGRTFVSAPVATIKTTLLTYAILMTQPKIVLYSNDKKGAIFRSTIKKRYREIIELMPSYLYNFFKGRFPEFKQLDVEEYKSEGFLKQYNNDEIIILQDNYEFDSWATPENLHVIEDERTKDREPMRHLLVSSVNDKIDPATKLYLDGIQPIMTHDISIPAMGIKAGSRLVSVPLETINRLRTDRARNKYYKNIILTMQQASGDTTLDSIFGTR